MYLPRPRDSPRQHINLFQSQTMVFEILHLKRPSRAPKRILRVAPQDKSWWKRAKLNSKRRSEDLFQCRISWFGGALENFVGLKCLWPEYWICVGNEFYCSEFFVPCGGIYGVLFDVYDLWEVWNERCLLKR